MVHRVVSDTCRGFREKCFEAPEWWISIAWDGAKQWPSEYMVCGKCENATSRMIDTYRAKHGRSCVEYGVISLARYRQMHGDADRGGR